MVVPNTDFYGNLGNAEGPLFVGSGHGPVNDPYLAQDIPVSMVGGETVTVQFNKDSAWYGGVDSVYFYLKNLLVTNPAVGPVPLPLDTAPVSPPDVSSFDVSGLRFTVFSNAPTVPWKVGNLDSIPVTKYSGDNDERVLYCGQEETYQPDGPGGDKLPLNNNITGIVISTVDPDESREYTFDLALRYSTETGFDLVSVFKRQDPTWVLPTVHTGGYTYDVFGNPLSGLGNIGGFMRSGTRIPSIAVNPANGFLYVVYQTGQFREDFIPQIGLTTSRDGGYTWSERVLINATPQDAPNPNAMTPNVSVTKDGYVAVMYTDLRNSPNAIPNRDSDILADTFLAFYKEVAVPGTTGVGLDFIQELQVSTKSSIVTGQRSVVSSGYMTAGDYFGLVAHDNNFYAVRTETGNSGNVRGDRYTNEDDTQTMTIVTQDSGYRQNPFVTVVKPGP